MSPDWEKCERCVLDGKANCKVAMEQVKNVEHCRGPYPLTKKAKRRKKRRKNR